MGKIITKIVSAQSGMLRMAVARATTVNSQYITQNANTSRVRAIKGFLIPLFNYQ